METFKLPDFFLLFHAFNVLYELMDSAYAACQCADATQVNSEYAFFMKDFV